MAILANRLTTRINEFYEKQCSISSYKIYIIDPTPIRQGIRPSPLPLLIAQHASRKDGYNELKVIIGGVIEQIIEGQGNSCERGQAIHDWLVEHSMSSRGSV